MGEARGEEEREEGRKGKVSSTFLSSKETPALLLLPKDLRDKGKRYTHGYRNIKRREQQILPVVPLEVDLCREEGDEAEKG